MFEVFFLHAFTIMLVIANIYCFIKKKYLYLFIPCMLFLPIYYGFEIHWKLPLITVTRIMYVIFYIYAYKNRKRDLYIGSLKIKEIPKEYWLLAGYFILRIFSNLHYISTYGQALKTIALLIFEQLFLLLAVYILNPDKNEYIVLMKTVVWSATALFVIGVFESISSIRIFDALYTVTRELYNLRYIRFGLLRATTTMYAPTIFGNMCILILPLSFYLYEQTREKKYLVVSGFGVLAIIHSGSRSDMFFLVLIAGTYMFFALKGINRRILFLKNSCIILGILFVYMCIASIFNEELSYYYICSGKAVLNEIGFDLAEVGPDITEIVVDNYSGSVTRIRQLTGIYYAMKRNPLFGLGSGAAMRGDVKYYWRFGNGTDSWISATAYDVGIVEILCDEGTIGFLGISSLLLFMIGKSRKNKYFWLLIFSYLLSTLSTGNMYEFLMFYLMLIMKNSSMEAKYQEG